MSSEVAHYLGRSRRRKQKSNTEVLCACAHVGYPRLNLSGLVLSSLRSLG